MQHSLQHHQKRIAWLLVGVGIMALMFALAIAPATARAKESGEVKLFEPRRTQLEIPIGSVRAATLSEYIILLHQYLVGASAIIAVIFIMFAGYRWLFSAGNKQYVAQAQDIIWTSVVGLFLALTSYVLLYTLNPKTVQFPMLPIPILSDKPLTFTVPDSICSGAQIKRYRDQNPGIEEDPECGTIISFTKENPADPENTREICMAASCKDKICALSTKVSRLTGEPIYESGGCEDAIYVTVDGSSNTAKIDVHENIMCGQLIEVGILSLPHAGIKCKNKNKSCVLLVGAMKPDINFKNYGYWTFSAGAPKCEPSS